MRHPPIRMEKRKGETIVRAHEVVVIVSVAHPIRCNAEFVSLITYTLSSFWQLLFLFFCHSKTTTIVGKYGCDYRRAVLVWAVLGMLFSIVQLILALTGTGVGVGAVVVGDDDASTTTDGYVFSTQWWYTLIGFGLSLCFYVFVLVAAIQLDVCMLVTSVVFQLVNMVFSINYWFNNAASSAGQAGAVLLPLIVYGLSIYANVGLVLEIKKGILSRETDEREAYCWCTQQKAEA